MTKTRTIFGALIVLAVPTAVSAKWYCEEYGNRCLEKTDQYERGLTPDGVYFVIRLDGAGCFGKRQGFMDCNEKTSDRPTPGRPWLISCSITAGARLCSGTDSDAAKLSYNERSGWTIGIGHNNFPGSPIRLFRRGGKFEEIGANDGWLGSTKFSTVYQHLLTPGAHVEWVEENFIEYGPKWNPGGTNGQTLQAVFKYLPWAASGAAIRPPPSNGDISLEKAEHRNFGVLDCYSLSLGSSILDGVAALGAPESIVDDQVNSAGVRGVTLKWQSDSSVCEARYQPRLERYSISDSSRFKELVNEWTKRNGVK